MSKMTIDLTNYRDTSGSRVDPGRYRVQVEWAEQGEARSGNAMITMGLGILGGEFAGSTLVDRLVMTERSMFRVVGFLQAIGFPTPKKRISVDPDKFVGRTLEVDVDDGEPYNGTIRSEVRGYIKVAKSATKDDFEDMEDADGSDPDEAEEQVDEEEEEPTPKKKGKSKSKPQKEQENTEAQAEDTEEADDDDEEVDLNDVDL